MQNSYASKNKIASSVFDGIGMALGFHSSAVTLIGPFRELLGAGQIFGFQIMPASSAYHNIYPGTGSIFVLAMLVAFQNKFKIGSARVKEDGTKGHVPKTAV